MKTKILSIITILMAFAMSSFAQPPLPPSADSAPNADASKISPRFKERILKEFDKDQDGYLNEEEMATAKKSFAERRARFEQMRKSFAEKVMKDFDKDGNGSLNAVELEALLEQHRRALFEAQQGNMQRQGPAFDGQNRPTPPRFRGGDGDRPQ